MTREQKMLFTSEHEEPRRALEKFIAAEINPFVDEWEKAELFPASELFKKLGDLDRRRRRRNHADGAVQDDGHVAKPESK
jgi:hypothetical protein